MLNIGAFNDLSVIDAEGISLVIYFQGCSRGCHGCHNPDLQKKSGGRTMTVEDIIKYINQYKDWYSAVVFQGGEPLEQDLAELMELTYKIKEELGLEVWLYTGYEYKDIPFPLNVYADVIIAGGFVEKLKTGGFPASSNQRVIDNRRN